MNILLVEDDTNFGLVLKNYLEVNKLTVDLSNNGKDGLSKFMSSKYDLCILDVMMPVMDGFSLAQKIRNINSSTPLLFLTARSLKEDIIKGYKMGAQDYLTKPFDPEILLLKIDAITGITPEKPATLIHETISFLNYKLNTERRSLHRDGVLIKELSPKAMALLISLLSRRNTLVSRESILNSIWKDNNYFTARSMDVYINKLRKLFEAEERVDIINIRGAGYILELKES